MYIDTYILGLFNCGIGLWNFSKSNKLTLVYLLCLMFNIVYTYDREIQKC